MDEKLSIIPKSLDLSFLDPAVVQVPILVIVINQRKHQNGIARHSIRNLKAIAVEVEEDPDHIAEQPQGTRGLNQRIGTEEDLVLETSTNISTIINPDLILKVIAPDTSQGHHQMIHIPDNLDHHTDQILLLEAAQKELYQEQLLPLQAMKTN